MNRSQVMRRAFALAAGAAVATAAALTVAAPASAHHSIVSGECARGADGSWIVTWTVGNSETDIPATLKEVAFEPTGSTLTGLDVGTSIPAGGSVTGTQVVPGTATEAELKIKSEWVRNGNTIGEKDGKSKKGKVEFDEATCAPAPNPPPPPPPAPTPSATPTPTSPASPPAPTPTATPAPGGGGGLPVTGSAVGGILAAAAVLLAAGAGLFLIARRRRVRFTA